MLAYSSLSLPSSHVLLAVDPGKWHCGVSIWHVTGEGGASRGLLLGAKLACWEDATRAKRTRDNWDPGVMVGALMLARASLVPSRLRDAATVWMVERPRKYPNQRRETHKDLAALEAIIATLAASDAFETGILRCIYPHEWKGNVPKPVHHRRVLENAGFDGDESYHARAMDEDGPVYQADVADAIGLGSYATGRTGRGGVVAGAA